MGTVCFGLTGGSPNAQVSSFAGRLTDASPASPAPVGRTVSAAARTGRGAGSRSRAPKIHPGSVRSRPTSLLREMAQPFRPASTACSWRLADRPPRREAARAKSRAPLHAIGQHAEDQLAARIVLGLDLGGLRARGSEFAFRYAPSPSERLLQASGATLKELCDKLRHWIHSAHRIGYRDGNGLAPGEQNRCAFR